jgi:hypothetical protein
LGVFFKEDVGGVGGAAVGLVIFDCFQSEFDHFCDDEELLKDGCLLSVFGKDKKLS